MRAASGLALVGWIFGAMALVSLLLSDLLRYEFAAVGLILLIALGLGCWLWSGREMMEVRAAAPRGDRLPGDVHDVLTLIDALIDALERGEDTLFDVEATRLGRTLDQLRPLARGYLEERGADPLRLRSGVCASDPDAKLVRRLSADRRRALHHELVRFAAAARGRPCGDPYRSRIGGGRASLGASHDPALGLARRRFLVILAVLVFAWGVAASTLANRYTLPWDNMCNPFVDPGCGFGIDVRLLEPMVEVLMLVPLVLFGAAAAARVAAWRSWAAALPESERGDASSWLRSYGRALRVLPQAALVFGIGVALDVFDWSWSAFARGEQLLVIPLVTLAVVVIQALTENLERRGALRRHRHRIERALPDQQDSLTDLFALRQAAADAAPARGELLEQLADTLAEAESLGKLAPERRDSIVARLRTASERGPALRREQRDRLLLDVENCETLMVYG